MRRAPSVCGNSWIAAVLVLLPAATVASGFDEADAVTEQCLAKGTIVKKIRNLDGVTHPELFLINCNGTERPAVVKRLHETTRGIKRFEDGSWEMNYSDSYRYERAAYLLDRELGLDMVPVAVIREVRRSESAVLEWIDEASHVQDAPRKPTGPQMAELARQKALMRLFDALIYNVDRNPSNYLVDDEDWRLYLIDHSRAFRELNSLPKSFKESRARLSRGLYERLEGLEEESLTELMDGLISQGQVKKMLERRDRILEKIERDCQEWGDSVIFSG